MYQIDYCPSFERFGGSTWFYCFVGRFFTLSIVFSVKSSASEVPLKLFWKLCCNFEPANVETLNKTQLNNKKIIISQNFSLCHVIIEKTFNSFITQKIHYRGGASSISAGIFSVKGSSISTILVTFWPAHILHWLHSGSGRGGMEQR